MRESIQGYVEHIVYRNEENGYTVMSLETGNDDITCVGTFPELHEGEYMEADGSYVIHPSYGPQFKITSYRVRIPDGGIAFERYLGSGAIKGIGPRLAGRILEHFGSETQRILEEEPERLYEVKGISERKAADIASQIAEKSQMQNALIFLSQYGISLNLSIKIFNFYKDRLYRVLRSNPYQLAEDIEGIGFRVADKIAARAGIRPDSEYRIRSGILYVLQQAGADGNIFLPQEELLGRTRTLLGMEEEPDPSFILDLVMDRKIVTRKTCRSDGGEEIRIYPETAYISELNTARMLDELNVSIEADPDRVLKKLKTIEREDGLTLDEKQREAILAAAGNGLLVLTGGPGTGKTTAINTMIRYFRSENMDIVLAAPTGRAARRMTETTGYEASTIHRLLEISGGMEDGSPVHFERNAEHPLEADAVIIDEMSMVDLYLMHALLSAVVPGTHLVLVGDVNQLPSVGPGSVLKDIIRSGCCKVVRLTHIFRQAAQSDIVTNAHRINRGEIFRPDNKSRDFFFLERSDPRVIQKTILRLVQSSLPGYVEAEPFDIQVLTPMRKGAMGSVRMNQILQRYLNPPDRKKQEVETSAGVFREGDKVMQIRNNYQMEWEVRGAFGIAGRKGTGVFNGDIGRIIRIQPQSETLEIMFDEERICTYSYRQLDELEPAYAITVHKSQGSEYPAVVIPLMPGPPLLMTRNLLYTAVTRAKSAVVLIGNGRVFEDMIRNEQEEHRYTSLDERIREIGGMNFESTG